MRGGEMFDKQSLKDLAETIVYVNFLLALLAIIALYDQRKIWDAEVVEDNSWHNMIESKLLLLERKVARLESLLAGVVENEPKGQENSRV